MKTIKDFTIGTFKNDSVLVRKAIKDIESILETMVGLEFMNMEQPMEEGVSYKISSLLKDYVEDEEQEWKVALQELRYLLPKEKLVEVDSYLKKDTFGKVRYLYGELLYLIFSEYQHYAVELHSKARNKIKKYIAIKYDHQGKEIYDEAILKSLVETGGLTKNEYDILLCKHEDLLLRFYK